MPYQYKREPLSGAEANQLANACGTAMEKLVVWVLLDTGLRVAELSKLSKQQIDWQTHRLTIYGKGGPYGTRSKRLLGHDRLTTTEIYLNLSPEMVVEEFQRKW